ncbi:MAG: hypothetical protein M3495_21835 [Pseudomonadota bacterium]|nr:hypothetical protein [Pseudomonadota bacterium]
MEGQLLARGSMEKSQLERRVRERLDVLWLGEFEARRPHQLSRGQPERAAFARTLVNDPKALLRLPCATRTGAIWWRTWRRRAMIPAVRPGSSLWLDWRSDAVPPRPGRRAERGAKDSPVAGSLSAVRTRSTGCP